jgi:hypothetical protein
MLGSSNSVVGKKYVNENNTWTGTNTYQISPMVPNINDLTDSSQKAANTKFVQDVVKENEKKLIFRRWNE